jgi:indolepyruvate ferredoxin oxidoreductase, alpha subunit
MAERLLLNGNEAVAHAALDAGVQLGAGYPGTPSTEILETFSSIGGNAEWAPNEKVALEVAVGAAFGRGRAIATMKHVGLNVAADPLFTAAYTGVSGALVIAVADDPGMASSQNEQDSRRYAVAAGVPMLEPSDSQDAYAFLEDALRLSETQHTPVLLRLTTRVSHSKSIVQRRTLQGPPEPPHFERDIPGRVMVPAYARPAHRRLRARLAAIREWAESTPLNRVLDGDSTLGIVAAGVAAMHAREAAPGARLLKLGVTYPLAVETVRSFAASVERCVVIEEGDPVLAEACRAAGIAVESAPELYRFGELNVARVRRILAGDTSPEPAPPRGKPPQLCPGCPHRVSFELLRDMQCIVAGDIGCYTLGVLPPFEAMDTCVCMGAAIGVGLGLRHVLPPDEARRVVSVIGDSTFVHSGITGLVEMAYNPPPTGHVVLILDNGTTAMTGLQEHPGTGRRLDHGSVAPLVLEDLAKAVGMQRVAVVNPQKERERLGETLRAFLDSGELCVLIARSPCLLHARRLHKIEKTQDRDHLTGHDLKPET